MTVFYASKTIGNDAWDGTAPAFVSGSTGPKGTARAAMALIAADGDQVALYAGDDFSAETFGTLGVIELTASFNNITVTTYGGTSRAKITCPKTSKTATSVTSGATTTITIGSSHGRAVGQWVSDFSGFAARGITGLDGAQGYITATAATTITVNIATTGTWTAGTATVQFWENAKSGISISGNRNSTISNLEITQGHMGVTVASTAGSLVGGLTFYNCYIHHNNYHGAAHQDSASTGESSCTWSYCTFSYNRNDHCNSQGNGTTGWFKLFGHHCTMDHGGYDPDGTQSYYTPAGTSSRSSGAGGGDGYTSHNKCYGDYWNNTISYGSQSGVGFVNTVNTSRVWNNWIYEISGNGILQTSGGALTAFGNMVVAPLISGLDSGTDKGCLTMSGAGAAIFINNTLVTARGTASATSVATTVHCATLKAHTGTLTWKNNACISNGTAPLMCVSVSAQTNMVAQYNFYSHTTALFHKQNNNTLVDWTSWKTQTIGGATLDTTGSVAGGTGIVGGSNPTAITDFLPAAGSVLKKAGTDLSGLGITEWLTDYYGRARTATPNIGALASLPGGGAFGSLGGILQCPGLFTF